MSQNERRLNRSERAYEALLLAYPREFRQEYGRHLTQVFGDLCREEAVRRGTMRLVGFWARTLVDLIASALVERAKTSGGVLLDLGGRVANVKGLIVANATLVVVAALFSLPGPGHALGELLRDQQGSLGPLTSLVVWTTHFLYPLAASCVLVRVLSYPERGIGRAATAALLAFNAVACLLLVAAQARRLAEDLMNRSWFIEKFGIDPLVYSIGAIVAGVAAAAIYMLFALGYAYFLRRRPAVSEAVPVEGQIGGRP